MQKHAIDIWVLVGEKVKVWVVYTCKRYPDYEISHPCVVAVLTDKEKAKSVARKNGAWMTEVEVDKISDKECL